jgi:hypothetical protein
MNREDANASIQLAAAAKRDSSAMKIIAIMTMAFLPATFFAALFAIPSLQWNAAKVIQDRFWIYWAFTLPCTALVFVVWLLITQSSLATQWAGHLARMAKTRGRRAPNSAGETPQTLESKHEHAVGITELPSHPSTVPGSARVATKLPQGPEAVSWSRRVTPNATSEQENITAV